ncbi:GH3 family [Dillenia turbinata]|uniref:GH3 family n=1 Tax=Dillenia turbinata TaxID=194707 RepID=A0AAN8ZGS0_9MAGN
MMSDDEILNKIEECSVNAMRCQHNTLSSILERNGGVRYLQPYLQRYRKPIDAETFRRSVPITSYDDYSDHIQRLADGVDDAHDASLLSVDPLRCFFYSSGTTSMKPKLIPYFDSAASKAASSLAHQASTVILRRLFPPRDRINKIMWFLYGGDVKVTKGGYKAMAASTFPFHNNTANPLLSICVSPREVILGSNVEQQMYCHLICGLRNFDVVYGIRAPYAAGLIRAFSLLESKWKQLCHDLEHGFLSFDVPDVAMRDAVVEILGGPQLGLSVRIRSICGQQDWGGIVGKLWPEVRYIRCVTTGTMRQYYEKLKYYAGDIPVLGGDYFSSECAVGINLDSMQPPELTQYVLLPTAAYFEFLPYGWNEASSDKEQIVDISGVRVGKMYELVVTTHRGLFRYRLGDVVRVVGFYNSSPKVEFVMRAPKTPNEIITEKDLMSAIESFQVELKNAAAAEVMEYASYLDMNVSPKQVKIFLELAEGCLFLKNEKLHDSVLDFKRCCSLVEDKLGILYKSQRERGEVGPLLVSVVMSGTFDKIVDVAIQNGAPPNQYKPPKIIRNREIADFMESSKLVTVCLNSLNG